MNHRIMAGAALVALAFAPVASAHAADQAAATSTPTKAATSVARVHHMTAQVKAVDTTAKTLTVNRSRYRVLTFTAAPEAAGSLADLKPGERVRITYEWLGGKRTAQSITPVTHAAAK